MCAIFTFTEKKLPLLYDTIERACIVNADGYSALFVVDGEITTRIQGLDYADLTYLLGVIKFSRCFLHLRNATLGEVSVANCHFFDTPDGRYAYCHNGMIECDPSCRVDSLEFGKMIDEQGPTPWIDPTEYANLFVVSHWGGSYYVHRSMRGTLFTDGCGNYATNNPSGKWKDVETGWYEHSSRKSTRWFGKFRLADF